MFSDMFSDMVTGEKGEDPKIQMMQGMFKKMTKKGKDDALSTKNGVVHLTHHTFEATLMKNTDMPFVVFVYADWCGHCTNFKSSFKKIVDENAQNSQQGKIGFALYNFDNPKSNEKLAGDIKCDSFPCIQIYHKGRTDHVSCKEDFSNVRNQLSDIVHHEISVLPDCKGKFDKTKAVKKPESPYQILDKTNLESSVMKNPEKTMVVTMHHSGCSNCQAYMKNYSGYAEAMTKRGIEVAAYSLDDYQKGDLVQDLMGESIPRVVIFKAGRTNFKRDWYPVEEREQIVKIATKEQQDSIKPYQILDKTNLESSVMKNPEKTMVVTMHHTGCSNCQAYMKNYSGYAEAMTKRGIEVAAYLLDDYQKGDLVQDLMGESIPRVVIFKAGRTNFKRDWYPVVEREQIVKIATKEQQDSIKPLEHLIKLDSQETFDKHCHSKVSYCAFTFVPNFFRPKDLEILNEKALKLEFIGGDAVLFWVVVDDQLELQKLLGNRSGYGHAVIANKDQTYQNSPKKADLEEFITSDLVDFKPLGSKVKIISKMNKTEDGTTITDEL